MNLQTPDAAATLTFPGRLIDMPARTEGAELADMFDLAPVSLWLEDFSGVRELFETWRAEGVDDLREFLRAVPQRVAACSARIRVLKVNRRTLEMFEADSLEHLVDNLSQVFRGDMLETHIEELGRLWDGLDRFSNDGVNYSLQGRRIDIQINFHKLPGHEASWSRVLVAIEDVTERARAQRMAHLSEQHARGLFEHSPVSLWVEDFSHVKQLIDEVRDAGVSDFRTFTNVHPEFVERCMQEIRVVDVNAQTLSMFGARDREELLRNLHRVFRDDMRAHFCEQLIDLWNGKTLQQREVVNYSLSGEMLHVYLQFSVLPGHESDWSLVQVALVDITARKRAEAYLEFLGKHDALTKLRNRSFFGDEMNRLERRGPWPVSVAILDLNGLKQANDLQGHAAGDALLRRAGEVLAKAIDKTACAARIGGDEFALLLPATDARQAEQVVKRLQELVDMNNQFYGGLPLSFAVGVVTAVNPGERLEAWVHRADQAMYEQKRLHYQAAGLDRRQGRDMRTP